MVYESRVGDVFTLGTSTWRIEDITHDRVLVTPAPGQPGRLPFWKGDTLGRPAELGAAVGAFVREVGGLPEAASRSGCARPGWTSGRPTTCWVTWPSSARRSPNCRPTG
jgi:ATP-dependent Lhr-like helicase